MNARQELKEVKKALRVMRKVYKTPELDESEMLKSDLSEIVTKYTYRMLDLEDATARKPAKKAQGGAS